jgi:hypothetical protein
MKQGGQELDLLRKKVVHYITVDQSPTAQAGTGFILLGGIRNNVIGFVSNK